jgi:hypothetical protein
VKQEVNMASDGDYGQVNAAWANEPHHTSPSGEEALRCAKRLYSRWLKRAYRGKWKLTSGNRNTYPRYGTFYVNPCSWSNIVHGLSHCVHRRLNPGVDSHDASHAAIEHDMIEYVKASGWLEGKLKPKVTAKADPVRARHEAVLHRIEKWEAKERRAKNALKKLRRQRAYYEARAAKGK